MPESAQRRPVAAIVGGATGSPELLALAEALGRGLVDHGLRIATGGRGGVMAAASRGGRTADGWEEGRVVAVLPGLDPADANPWADIVLPTGLNHARNVVLVAMADVVIAVGGGSGTLSEVALAWQHAKPIVAVDIGEGWSARLAGQTLDPRHSTPIRRAGSAEEAVQAALEALRNDCETTAPS